MLGYGIVALACDQGGGVGTKAFMVCLGAT